MRVDALFRRQRRTQLCLFNEPRKAILTIFQGGQFGGELELFFRELHGAEMPTQLIHSGGRFAGFGCGRWFLRRLHLLVGFMAGAARFLVAGAMFPVAAAMGFVVPRSARLMLLVHLPRRLDTAERPAKFFDLPFVGEFLALGHLDQFKDFIQKVKCVLQRFCNFGGVSHGLADGGGLGRAKIGRAAPLPLFRTTMFMLRRLGMRRGTGAHRLAFGGPRRLGFGLPCGGAFGSCLGRRFGVELPTFLSRPGLPGFFRMRFAESA